MPEEWCAELTWSFLPRTPPIDSLISCFCEGRLGRQASLSGHKGFFVFVTSQESLTCDLTADLQNLQKLPISFVNQRGLPCPMLSQSQGYGWLAPVSPSGCPKSADTPPQQYLYRIIDLRLLMDTSFSLNMFFFFFF